MIIYRPHRGGLKEAMSEAKELIASIYDLFNSPEEIRWVVSSKNREELYRKLVKGGTPNVF